MCIFSSPVKSVTDTHIAVVVIPGGRQLTIYQNKVTLVNKSAPTAMILPFPTTEGSSSCGDGVHVIDTTGFDSTEFFDQLQKQFEIPKHLQQQVFSKGSNSARRRGGDAETDDADRFVLPVHECGHYKYSIATSLKDLDHVQNDVFHLSRGLSTFLAAQYAVGFGFIVCMCTQSGVYEPIAYTHPMMDGKLFVPTMHDHHSEHGTNQRADWSHTIYVMGCVEDATETTSLPLVQQPDGGVRVRLFNDPVYGIVAQKTGIVSLPILHQHLATPHVHESELAKQVPREFLNLYSHRYVIRGKQLNGDLEFRSSDWLERRASQGCTARDCAPQEMTGSDERSASSSSSATTTFVVQPWYECYTCDLTRHRGMCAGCRFQCHRGHNVAFHGVRPALCDCCIATESL